MFLHRGIKDAKAKGLRDPSATQQGQCNTGSSSH